jgi:hypothetical protein
LLILLSGEYSEKTMQVAAAQAIRLLGIVESQPAHYRKS